MHYTGAPELRAIYADSKDIAKYRKAKLASDIISIDDSGDSWVVSRINGNRVELVKIRRVEWPKPKVHQLRYC